MKFIRWPFVTLILFGILFSFFYVGYFDNSTIKEDLEFYSSEALNSIVRIGKLNLNVFHSVISGENIFVIDPGNKSKPVFKAKQINLRADVTKFLEQRIFLREVVVKNGDLRLLQTKNGSFDFISDDAVTIAEYEPVIVKIQKVITKTADKINPIKTISMLGDTAESSLKNDESLKKFEELPLFHNSKKKAIVRGFQLKLPKDYPDLLVKRLLLANCSIELIPPGKKSGIVLNNIFGKAFELSSLPKKHPKPITIAAKGKIGKKDENAWFNISARIDLYAGKTNILVDCAISNVNILSVLPLVKVYSDYTDIVDIASGNLTLRGRFNFENGIILPSTLYCYFYNLSAKAMGKKTGQKWLNSFSFQDANLEISVPVDNSPPFFHFEKAMEGQNFKTEIKNFRMKIKASDLKGDLFD